MIIASDWTQVNRKHLYTRTYKRVNCEVTEVRSYSTLIMVIERYGEFTNVLVGGAYNCSATTRRHFNNACELFSLPMNYRTFKDCATKHKSCNVITEHNFIATCEWRVYNHYYDMRLGHAPLGGLVTAGTVLHVGEW